MNKTITINLGGINFYIDEDAYHHLKQYLEAVSVSLDIESRDETMRDIEARIAELIIEDIQDKNKVVNQNLVQKIITIMGQPEDYQAGIDDSVPQQSAADKNTEDPQAKPVKKLYRDVEHRTIAGVCSGLGYYFGISRSWVRVIFLLLFLPIFTSKILLPGGSTILLIYIILWIAVPAARTTTEKLQMQGDKIDIDNIERKVKEEYQNLKNKVREKDYSDFGSFLEKVGNVLVALVKGFAIVIGISIVIVAAISLVAVIASLFSLGALSISGVNPIAEMTVYFSQLPGWLVYLSITILSGVPLLLLLFAGLKIINPKMKIISLTGILIILGIWVLSLIPFIVAGVQHLDDYDDITGQEFINHKRETDLNPADTLYVTRLHGSGKEPSKAIVLKIKPTTMRNKIEINHRSKSGYDSESTEDPDYQFTQNEDTLKLADSFLIPANSGSRLEQDLEVFLYFDNSVVFKIDKTLESVIKNFSSDYINQKLQYKDGKLSCLSCKTQPKDQSDSSDESEWYRDTSSEN